MLYIMSLIDGQDGSTVKEWGPMPWDELEQHFPEVKTDKRGMPLESVHIERIETEETTEPVKAYWDGTTDPDGVKEWKCSVCGYRWTEQEEPENCPNCGKGFDGNPDA